MLPSCSSRQHVAPTEIRVVDRLEFVPVPPSLTARHLAPMPPLDATGLVPLEESPEYAAEVLGVLEQCNLSLWEIDKLMLEGVKK